MLPKINGPHIRIMKNSERFKILLGAALILFCELNAQTPNILNYQGRVLSGGTPFDGVGQFKFALLAPSGSGASAQAIISNGFVTSVTLNDGGTGYTTPPLVRLNDGGGSGATATAAIVDGKISNIVITNPGSGYLQSPTISFEPAEADYGIVWRNDESVSSTEPLEPVALNVNKGLFNVRLGDTSYPNMASLSEAIFQRQPLMLRLWFNDGRKGWQQLSGDAKLASSPTSIAGVDLEARQQIKDLIRSLNAGRSVFLSGTITIANNYTNSYIQCSNYLVGGSGQRGFFSIQATATNSKKAKFFTIGQSYYEPSSGWYEIKYTDATTFRDDFTWVSTNGFIKIPNPNPDKDIQSFDCSVPQGRGGAVVSCGIYTSHPTLVKYTISGAPIVTRGAVDIYSANGNIVSLIGLKLFLQDGRQLDVDPGVFVDLNSSIVGIEAKLESPAHDATVSAIKLQYEAIKP
jgi:hypothetical protein